MRGDDLSWKGIQCRILTKMKLLPKKRCYLENFRIKEKTHRTQLHLLTQTYVQFSTISSLQRKQSNQFLTMTTNPKSFYLTKLLISPCCHLITYTKMRTLAVITLSRSKGKPSLITTQLSNLKALSLKDLCRVLSRKSPSILKPSHPSNKRPNF